MRRAGPATPAPRAAPARPRPLRRPPPPLLSQPSVRLAAVSACSPGTATTSGFGSHLFFQNGPGRGHSTSRRRAPLTPPPGDLARAQGGGGGPRVRTGRARQSAGSGSGRTALPSHCCSLLALPEIAQHRLVISPACVTNPPPPRAVASRVRETGLRRDDLPPENTSSYKTVRVGSGKDAGHTEAHEVRTHGRAHRSLL